MDGQFQRCSLILTARPCDNCLRQSHAMSLQPPPPPPSLVLTVRATVFTVRATVLTSFMNEDRTSLTNFRRFATLDEPNYLLCCVYGGDGNVCHPSRSCLLLLDGHQCFKCLRPHPRSNCRNSIPQSLDSCPKCHLLHNR
jgi:hypothetical protein